jgi:hypothetical protein
LRRRAPLYDAPVLRRPVTLVVAIAIAASLLTSGCGGDGESNDYVDRVNDIQQELVSKVTDATKTNLGSQKEAADYAGTIAGIFSDAADQFEAIDPPADVADLHAELVDQMRSIAGDTEKAEQTLRTGSPQEAQKALTDLQKQANAAQTEFTSLIDRINSELHD